jgi:hypothetical protein
MKEILRAIWLSFRSLPIWVQVWVLGILIPVNASAFVFLELQSAQWAAWAAMFVVATNIPIMLRERGLSKLMALPHLIVWVPLEIMLLLRLASHPALLEPEQIFSFVILLVNGIGIAFDTFDTWRWLRGDRAVAY